MEGSTNEMSTILKSWLPNTDGELPFGLGLASPAVASILRHERGHGICIGALGLCFAQCRKIQRSGVKPPYFGVFEAWVFRTTRSPNPHFTLPVPCLVSSFGDLQFRSS